MQMILLGYPTHVPSFFWRSICSEDSRILCMWAYDFMTECGVSIVNRGWSSDTPFTFASLLHSERGKVWSASRKNVQSFSPFVLAIFEKLMV